MGVINDKEIAKIVNLDEEETVAAIIVYGYPESEVAPTNRKSVEEITRFI
jgi:nitroreductase